MARKVANRKELRAEAEAAETAPKKKKKATKRKSRAKDPTPERVKLYWGVFSQSLKRVAVYEYTDKKSAVKRAEELSASGKSPHFVQKVKEAVEEA